MINLKQGDIFAGCRIITMCGHGGMGTVYLAKDALDRTVALKIVSIPDTERELRGIRKYIQVARDCPNLIQIYHAGVENDFLYYIMEAADPLENSGGTYIPKTLSAVLASSRKLQPDEALSMIHSLASGLEVLHKSELIHRDIKPENVIFVDNVPKLCDPGLVCEIDATVSFVGTLGYLPHECFNGLNLNTCERDIYALGKVLYVAVTGESASRYPFLPIDLPLSIRRQLWPALTRVCENNPKHRFHSVEEFCQALPKTLIKPTKLDLIRESFLQWRLAHPGAMSLLFLFLLISLISGIGGFYFYIRKQKMETERLLEEKKREMTLQIELQRQEYERSLKADKEKRKHLLELLHACEKLEKSILKNDSALFDQIAAAAGGKKVEQIKTALKTLPLDYGKRLEILKKIDSGIREIALKEIPEIPAGGNVDEIHKISSGVRGLFLSPLGDWISKDKKSQVMKKLKSLEAKIYPSDRNLQPEKDFLTEASLRFKFVYVPAGSYRNKKGEIVRIENSFWCNDGEIRMDHFTGVLKMPMTSAHPDLPMTKFTWNDLLSYCRELTIIMRQQGRLPDGFIFRPLQTSEWEWVYRGAWAGEGTPTKLLKKESKGHIHPVSSGLPNNLGIYDMAGNVMEITMSDLRNPDDYCARISGGWYNSTSVDPEKHSFYLKYQFLPPFVGSRIVVAPGTMEFFEKHLWTHGPRQLVHGGKIYEVLTSNESSIKPEPARQICSFLGGRLFVPESGELLKKLQNEFFETNSFHVNIDGYFADGKWRRPDGKPYTGFPLPPLPNFKRWCLVFLGGRIQCFKRADATGAICQWTEDEYKNRKNPDRIRKHPAVLHSFEHKGKLYVLFPYRTHNHVLRRIAELLGGKLAEPKTPELQALFRKELAPWKEKNIMLGGVWRHDKWSFSDGSKFDSSLELKGTVYRNSLHSASIGLVDGKYCALQISQAFLLELSLPIRSAASGISAIH